MINQGDDSKDNISHCMLVDLRPLALERVLQNASEHSMCMRNGCAMSGNHERMGWLHSALSPIVILHPPGLSWLASIQLVHLVKIVWSILAQKLIKI